jgi:hypothetical protein
MEIQVSATNVSKLNDNTTVFGYDQVIAYNGYINFHKVTELNVLVAQGDIGQNELTGISKAYSLGSVAAYNRRYRYFLQTSKWTSVGGGTT